MRGLADYTTRARRFASRHPVLNHVSPQVSFWITAYILLSFTVHLASVNLALSFSVNIETSPLPIMLAGGITVFYTVAHWVFWIIFLINSFLETNH